MSTHIQQFTYTCPTCRVETPSDQAQHGARGCYLAARPDALPGGGTCADCGSVALLAPDLTAWAGRVGELPPQWLEFTRGLTRADERAPVDVFARRPLARRG